jgi:hypothetical protein
MSHPYFSSETNRKFLRAYVYPNTKAGYKFFRFRVNNPNRYLTLANVLRSWGYKVNAIFYEVQSKRDGKIIYSSRLQ